MFKRKRSKNSLEIYFFNVKKGDSILLRFPDGKVGIIDCNYDNKSKDPPLLRALKNLAIKSVLFVAISHPHADHYKGFKKVIEYIDGNNIPVEYFIDFGIGEISELFDFKEALSGLSFYKKDCLDFKAIYDFYNKRLADGKSKIEYMPAVGFDAVLLTTNGWAMKSYAPFHDDLLFYRKMLFSFMREKKFADDLIDHNILSSLLVLYMQKFSITFGGDVPCKQWEKVICRLNKIERSLNTCLLKVSHHGSLSSHFGRLFQSVFEGCDSFGKVGIISCGHGVRGLPHFDVIRDLITNRVLPFCTNRSHNCRTIKKFNGPELSRSALSYLENDLYPEEESCFGNILVRVCDNEIQEIITESADKCIVAEKNELKQSIPLRVDRKLWRELLQ
ncbi:MAG: hypothetical protein WA126_15695 [Thermodesulfovibrionales bacterium]